MGIRFLKELPSLLVAAVFSAVGRYARQHFVYNVTEGEKAVIFDNVRGVLDDPIPEGIHICNPVLQKPYIFDIRTRSHTFSYISRTKDLQQINLAVHLLIHPNVDRLAVILKTLGLKYEEKVLPSIPIEVINEAVSQFSAEQLITEHIHVSTLIRESLICRLSDFNIVLDDFMIIHLSYGAESSKAVEEKMVAQQQAERAKFFVLTELQQRARAEGEAEAAKLISEGEAEAAKLISEATASSGMGLIELRRIEAAKDIAAVFSKAPNCTWLPEGIIHIFDISDD